MSERTIKFTGYEIDRILDFLDLIEPPVRGRDATHDATIKRSVCEARATILSDESRSTVVHEFPGAPEVAAGEGYQRTLRFRVKELQDPLDFGGANAIREEWRLEAITFHYVNDVPLIDNAIAYSWLDTLFPMGSSLADNVEYGAALKGMRLIVMGVSPCVGQQEAIERIKKRLSNVLRDPNHLPSERERSACGLLLCDLQQEKFLKDHIGALRNHGSLEGRHLPTLLRQLFDREELLENSSLSVVAAERVSHIANSIRDLTALVRSRRGRREVDLNKSSLLLRDCWITLEAISFAKAIGTPILNDICLTLVCLDKLQAHAPPGLSEEISSAQSAAMLCYASLHNNPGHADTESISVDTSKQVRALVAKRMKKSRGTSADVTQRIAAMATLAMITPKKEISSSFNAIRASMQAAAGGAAEDVTDRAAAIAAGADSCGLLFKQLSFRDLVPSKHQERAPDRAARLITTYWYKEASSVIRRACARNIFEAVYNGVSLTYLGVVFEPSLASSEVGSLCYESGRPGPLAIDLPSQALLLTFDHWGLLYRLIENKEEYQRHPDCLDLSRALVAFVRAEMDAGGDIPAALAGFDKAAALIRALPGEFVAKSLTQQLATGIEARAKCCAIGARGGTIDRALEVAQTAYGSALTAASGPTAQEVDPDYWLSKAVKGLLDGIVASRYWDGISSWPHDLMEKFAIAVHCAKRSGSPSLIRLCDARVKSLEPFIAARAILEGSRSAEPYFGATEPPPANLRDWTVALIPSILGGIGRVLGVYGSSRRVRNIAVLVDNLQTCRMRPVGIVAVGRALQW